MRAIIVEDDKIQRTHLQKVCEQLSDVEVVACFENALDAMGFLKEEAVDVIFLDIEMPDFNGMDFVKQVSDLPQIVFTTGKEQYALEAFEHHVTDYLLKPITLPRLLKAVERVKGMMADRAETVSEDDIFVRSEGSIVRIPVEELQYVETLGDYVVFVMEDGKKHIVHSTLKAMAAKLSHPKLLKVHRSYIVNLSKVVDIEETNMVVADKVIPISRAHKSILMARINVL
ncbi:MAG TPA: DNA-binding response regulator [Cytophagales bacterium]|nr:DNA-binding response regulator [Cytophagales bacterium]HAA17576.1 DNA-binding response regulator [Cytophagales bacterium]HAP62505.1 DNA-binding response regulator [Cytophagales bacterium]